MAINKEADFIMKDGRAIYPPVISDESLKLWYDTKGKKNSDRYRDKMFDMSGNKNHGTLENFDYKNLSGYQEDSELVFDGIDDTLTMPKLNGIDANKFTYQLNNNILAFSGDEVKTVKNGNVEIGGRNLLLDSNKLEMNGSDGSDEDGSSNNGLTVDEGDHFSVTPQRGSGNIYNIGFKTSIPRVNGETYTFSIEINTQQNVRMYYRPSENYLNLILSTEGEWIRYEFTYIQTGETREAGRRFLVGFHGLSKGVTIRWRNPKIEKGNKATDWTPAPEDLIETTELNGNILGDMEDIIDDHTRDEQSGVGVFTDKADDSLVRVEVDGKSYQHAGSGKNLLNVKTYKGSIRHTNGEETLSESSTMILSDFIKVTPNTSYTLSREYSESNSHLGRYFYNKNKEYIHGVYGYKDSKITSTVTPEGTEYMKISYNINDTFVQVEEGSTATPYEPPAPTPDYPIEIHSLNDFDVVSSVGKENLIENVNGRPSSVYEGGSTPPTVELVNMKTPFGNEAYKITFPANNNTGFAGSRVRTNNLTTYGGKAYSYHTYVYYPDGMASGVHIYPTGSASMAQLSADTSKDIGEWKYYDGNSSMTLRLETSNTYMAYYANSVFSSPKTIYVSVVKFEEGIEATPYSPRPKDITPDTDHPLIDKINLSLTEPLRSVGDVKDRLFRDSDGLWKVERNVGILELANHHWIMGAESSGWGQSGETVSAYGYHIRYEHVPNVAPLVTHLKGYANSPLVSGDIEGFSVGVNNNYSTIRINKSRLSSVSSAGINNWIKENNPIAYYALKTEYSIIETLPQEIQDKLNNLRSFQDSNYVYTVINDKDDILPSHISENLKPTIHTEFLAKDHYKENRTVNNLLIWNRSLEDEELLNQNKLFHERFNMSSNTIKGEPINQTINLTQGGYVANTLSLEYTIEI